MPKDPTKDITFYCSFGKKITPPNSIKGVDAFFKKLTGHTSPTTVTFFNDDHSVHKTIEITFDEKSNNFTITDGDVTTKLNRIDFLTKLNNEYEVESIKNNEEFSMLDETLEVESDTTSSSDDDSEIEDEGKGPSGKKGHRKKKKGPGSHEDSKTDDVESDTTSISDDDGKTKTNKKDEGIQTEEVETEEETVVDEKDGIEMKEKKDRDKEPIKIGKGEENELRKNLSILKNKTGSVNISGKISVNRSKFTFQSIIFAVISIVSFFAAIFVPNLKSLSQFFLLGSGILSSSVSIASANKARKDSSHVNDIKKSLDSTISISHVKSSTLDPTAYDNTHGLTIGDILQKAISQTTNTNIEEHKNLIAFLFAKSQEEKNIIIDKDYVKRVFPRSDQKGKIDYDKVIGEIVIILNKAKDGVDYFEKEDKTVRPAVFEGIYGFDKPLDRDYFKNLDVKFDFYNYRFADIEMATKSAVNKLKNVVDNHNTLLTPYIEKRITFNLLSTWINKRDKDGQNLQDITEEERVLIDDFDFDGQIPKFETRKEYIEYFSRECLDIENKILSFHKDKKGFFYKASNALSSNFGVASASGASIFAFSQAAKDVSSSITTTATATSTSTTTIYSGENSINSVFNGTSSTTYTTEDAYVSALAQYYVTYNGLSSTAASDAAKAVVAKWASTHSTSMWKSNLSVTAFQAFQAQYTTLVQLNISTESLVASDLYSSIAIPDVTAYDTGAEINALTQDDINAIQDPYIKAQVQAQWDAIKALSNPTATELSAYDGKVTYPYSSISAILSADTSTITDSNLLLSIAAIKAKVAANSTALNTFVSTFYSDGINLNYLASIIGSQSEYSNEVYSLNEMISDAGGWDNLTASQQNECIELYNKLITTNITDPQLMAELVTLSNYINAESLTMSDLFTSTTTNTNLTNGVTTSTTYYTFSKTAKSLVTEVVTTQSEEGIGSYKDWGIAVGAIGLASTVLPEKKTTNKVEEKERKLSIQVGNGECTDDVDLIVKQIIENVEKSSENQDSADKKIKEISQLLEKKDDSLAEFNAGLIKYNFEISEITKTIESMSRNGSIVHDVVAKLRGKTNITVNDKPFTKSLSSDVKSKEINEFKKNQPYHSIYSDSKKMKIIGDLEQSQISEIGVGGGCGHSL